jgi:Adenylate and Guanylate cyclase catalytic domain
VTPLPSTSGTVGNTLSGGRDDAKPILLERPSADLVSGPGPVVGGVIGRRRLLFDLWGDTVNTASWLESSGVAGRMNVAATTRELLGDRCGFEERAIEIKGLGRVRSYLLE